MPSRDRNRETEPETLEFQFELYDGSVIPKSVIALTKYETMSDFVNPGFNGRVANGEVFCNPMSYYCATYEVLPSIVTYYKYKVADPSWWIALHDGNYTAHALSKKAIYRQVNNDASVPYLDVIALAKQRCLAKVDSTPYSFFEDLAELRETLLFLRNPAESLTKVARSWNRSRKRQEILKRNFKDKKREAEALADLWKTYSFAAAPLFRSILSALEAYNDRDVKRPARRTAHGTAHAENEEFTTQSVGTGSYEFWDYQKHSKQLVHGHATIYYEVSNPLVDWQFRTGLRFKDWFAGGWEIIPLSFMLDRLWNVKNAISGVVNTFDPRVTYLASSETLRQTAEHDLSCVGQRDTMNVMKSTISKPDAVRYTYFNMDRNVWAPGLVDTIPTFTLGNVTNSISKTLDLLALSISLFGSRAVIR